MRQLHAVLTALLIGIGSTSSADVSFIDTPFGQADQAIRLASQAALRQDPILMLAAVRLLDLSGLQPSRALVKTIAGTPSPESAPDRREWLAFARTWSLNNPELDVLLTDAQAHQPRGASIGSEVGRVVLSIQGIRIIQLAFAPPEKARFGITTDQGADLQLEILDPNNHPVCFARTDGRLTECEWLPAEAGEWRIRIENLGARPVQFVFFHN